MGVCAKKCAMFLNNFSTTTRVECNKPHEYDQLTAGTRLALSIEKRRRGADTEHEEAAMTVGDICNRNVVVAPKTEMVVDAAKRMRTSHVGDLVIVENRNGQHIPIGIVTDRDIVVSVVAGDPDHINYLLVSDVMSSDLVTAQEQDSIEAALKTMHEHGVRRLPIVDKDGALAGILTLDDVLKYLTGQQSLLVALVAREQRHERE